MEIENDMVQAKVMSCDNKKNEVWSMEYECVKGLGHLERVKIIQ